MRESSIETHLASERGISVLACATSIAATGNTQIPRCARDDNSDWDDKLDRDDDLEWSAVLMRQVAIFHRQFAVDPHYIDLVIDRPDIDQAHRTRRSLDQLKHVFIGINGCDRRLMSRDK